MKQKILIVNAGGRGALSAANGDYDTWATSLHMYFEIAERGRVEAAARHGRTVEPMSVEVVKSTEGIEVDEGLRAVIFLSLSMENTAQRIKQARPDVNVIVVTGLIPNDRVIVFEKDWISPEVMHAAAVNRPT